MGGVGGVDTALDRGVGLLAGFDAIQPVEDMIHGAVTGGVDLLGSRRHVGLAIELAGFGVDLEEGPQQAQAASGAAEEDAAVLHFRHHRADVGDLELLRVEERDVDGVGGFEPGDLEFGALAAGFDGDAVAHDPVDGIDPVGEKVGQGAAAVIPEPTPVCEAPGVEFARAGIAEELVPIELGGIDGGRSLLGGVVLIPPGEHLGDLADAAGFNQLLSLQEVG
ncbi:MAG: hypothetical protein IPP47_00630 [Bryobacterales bacterium]|nr:hypothetical protein [Bryobacterales bacterium]